MRILAVSFGIAGFVAAYIIWVRPYLKTLPQFSEIYANADSMWSAVLTWIYGRRTILIGLWGEIVALAPDALQAIAGFDLKTLLGLPEHWAAYITALLPVLMMIFRAKAR